jgi:long-chain acyl-CoA synthetase
MEAQEALAMTASTTAVDTMPKMFAHCVATHGPLVSLRQKQLGIWHSITWSEFGRFAREVGMGLVALGFAPGECASVLSNTNREWLYADMGILGAGGVSNGIYPTDAPGCPSCATSSSSTWMGCAISPTAM